MTTTGPAASPSTSEPPPAASTADPRRDDWSTPDGAPVERPTHVLAHLSDTHLTPVGTRYNQILDADAALTAAVDLLSVAQAQGRRLDGVVATGDLTDTGDPDAYRRLQTALEKLGVPLVFATGNHDVRVQFHRSLLGRDDTGPVLQVHDLAGLRVVVLDSTIPGHGHGRLEPDHLAELAGVLQEPAPHGTVVALHHAPLPPPSPLLSYFALESSSRQALATTIAGTDVRLVLAGHHHLPQSGLLAGVPVAVAGSTAIRTDPLAPAGHERTWASGAVNLVEVYADTLTVSVVPLDGAAPVFDLDADGCRAVIQQHPTDRPSSA